MARKSDKLKKKYASTFMKCSVTCTRRLYRASLLVYFYLCMKWQSALLLGVPSCIATRSLWLALERGGHTPVMYWLLLLTAAVIAAIYSRWRRREMLKAYSEMPMDLPRWPIVGHGHLFRGTDEDRMTTFQRIGRVAVKQGGLSSFWLGHRLYVTIACPEAIEVVAKSCLEKDNNTMRFLRTVLGNANAFAPVKIWRPRRKIMAPTFHIKNLQEFVKIFERQSCIMVDLLSARAGRGDFSVWPYLTTYTFDAVCHSTLGVEVNSQGQPDHPFLHAFDGVTGILGERMLSPWLYWDWMFSLTERSKLFEGYKQYIFNFFDQMIQDKRKKLANPTHDQDISEPSLKTFLDMLIESSGGSKGYSNLELREETMNIVMAGNDTSATGSAYTVLMLARYPDVQEKVYQELQDVFGDTDRPVTWEDLPKLKYLEMVIKESLRLYPPVPVATREVTERTVLPTGQTLVPGMAIILHIWATHRNVAYWGEDADQFRPERFSDGPLRHPAQFLPFSYSIRNCPGSNFGLMSMKTNLARMLRCYKILPPSTLDAADLTKPLRVKFDIMMRDVDGFRVRIEQRKTV